LLGSITNYTLSPRNRETVRFERLGHFHQVESIEELLEEGDLEFTILAGCEVSEDDHIRVELLVPYGRQSRTDLCHMMSESVKRGKNMSSQKS